MAGLYSLPGLILRSLRRRPKASFVITQKNRVITKPAKTGESRFFSEKTLSSVAIPKYTAP